MLSKFYRVSWLFSFVFSRKVINYDLFTEDDVKLR